MENKKYSFDVIREDTQSNKILIRFAHKTEKEENKFSTIYEIEQICRHYLKRDIFISTEILCL